MQIANNFKNKEYLMKSWILRVCIIFISMILVIGIKEAYAQAINPDSFGHNIIKTVPHELMVEDAGSSGRLRSLSVNTRFKPVSQEKIWELDIKGTGQAGDASIVKIGIDPNGKAYPPPPFNPPGFTVVLKIKQGTDEFIEDIRPPSDAQEVWGLSLLIGGSSFGGAADIDLPGFFPVLTWDPNQISSAKVMELRLGDANGPVLLDMETNNTYPTKEADITDPSNYIPSLDYALISYAVVFEPDNLFTYYRDADEDGYGDPDDTIIAEELPPGYALNPMDCDDSDPNTYLGALEICDGKDNACDRIIDIEIIDPNNLDLEIEDLKGGLNKVLIETLCTSYSSYDFLLNFEGLLDIASLNLDERDVTGSYMSTYYFFGKICGNGFELSEDPSHPNLLYIY